MDDSYHIYGVSVRGGTPTARGTASRRDFPAAAQPFDATRYISICCMSPPLVSRMFSPDCPGPSASSFPGLTGFPLLFQVESGAHGATAGEPDRTGAEGADADSGRHAEGVPVGAGVARRLPNARYETVRVTVGVTPVNRRCSQNVLTHI